jgi:hypothetical protein
MAKIGAILDGEFLPYDEYLRRKAEKYRKASELSCPMLISDSMEILSMADGNMYTSKRAYRADLRARGYEEVGNEKLTRSATKEYVPEGIRSDIRNAIKDAK